MARRIFARWAPTQRILPVVLLATALVPMRLRANDASGDYSLLAFLSARGSERFDADRPISRPTRGTATVDLLYTFSYDKLRLLAEGAAATDNAEIDRLQVGWELVPTRPKPIAPFASSSSTMKRNC
jgi:hypothetical protein